MEGRSKRWLGDLDAFTQVIKRLENLAIIGIPTSMNQDRINDAQWSDPENWTGPKWVSLYFSKSDSRLWVRKQIPAMGWTLNLGHPKGAVCLIGFAMVVILFVVASNVIGTSFIVR